MRDALELAIVDVKAVSVRRVAGDGDQAEITVTTKRGALTLRLVGARGTVIRFSDRRGRRIAKHPGIIPAAWQASRESEAKRNG